MMTLRQVYQAAGLTLQEAVQVTEIIEGSSDEFLANAAGYEKLYFHFLDSHEMPYLVAKARTRCPDEWMLEHLETLG